MWKNPQPRDTASQTAVLPITEISTLLSTLEHIKVMKFLPYM